MINVLATDKLTIPFVMPLIVKCNTYELPAAKCIQLKADSELSIHRSIIHLITTPELRAAYIFHFKEDKTEWKVFEPAHAPLSINEVRGAMVYGIKQFRKPKFTLTLSKIRSNSFVHSTTSIVEYLESLKHDDKIYIILVFKNWSYAIGSYFDETSICRALLEYRPRKGYSVIRNMEKDKRYFIPKSGDLNQPKEVRFPDFILQ